jgi:hypothetical protein
LICLRLVACMNTLGHAEANGSAVGQHGTRNRT